MSLTSEISRSQQLVVEAVLKMQKLLENENPPSLILCFQDLENKCLHAQKDSKSNYYCSHLKRLKKLIDMGQLDVNARYELGNTMLHFAARDANSRAIKLLLDNGADANMQNDSNETPLFFIFAAKSSNERKRECVEILMLYGADYELVDSKGDSLINIALKNGSFFSLQPIVAHLAWLQGLSINEHIFNQINFVRTLKNYYRTCIQHLDEMKYKRIHEHVTEYDILTQSEEKIAVSYLKDPITLRKLEQYEIHSDYFYNSLFKIQILKAMEMKRLRIDAGYLFRKSIKLFQYSSHIIVDKIIGYLSHEDLHTLKRIVEEEEKQEEYSNRLADKSC